MTGRDTLKERSAKPVKVAESDIDVSIKHHFSASCTDLSISFVQLHDHYYAPGGEILKGILFCLVFKI